MSSISRLTGCRATRLAGLASVAGAALLLAACGSMHSDSMGAGSSSSQEMGGPSRSNMPSGVNSTDTNLDRPDSPSKSGPPSTVKPAQ